MILLYNYHSKEVGNDLNNKEESSISKNKGKNKNKKPQNDINDEQILKYVQKEFIRAYMRAYSQKEITEQEFSMFMKCLNSFNPINTSCNHYFNRLKGLCNEMKSFYSKFIKIYSILGTTFKRDETNFN